MKSELPNCTVLVFFFCFLFWCAVDVTDEKSMVPYVFFFFFLLFLFFFTQDENL